MMTDTDRTIGQTKVCSKCQIEKTLSEFYKSKKERFGVMSHCIECDKAKGKAYYEANNERIRERTNSAKKNNPELHKEQNRRWYENNKTKNYERSKEWRIKNPEKQRAFTKKSESKNPHFGRERNRKRRQTPIGKLENSIRVGFHRGLTKGGKSGLKTFEILGYSSLELKAHIENQFQRGMSWTNYGRGAGCWHIDHIIPLAVHNYKTPNDIDFRRAWALKNLRPMWSTDNLAKGAKLNEPFQPSLAISVATSDIVCR